jgi:hypothetical protein
MLSALPEPMEAGEVAERLSVCARLLDAWPNSRPMNRDRTLIEYVNATRGVRLEHLGRCIQLAIDSGGEWLPAAGEIVHRAAVQSVGGPYKGSDTDRRYWHELKVSKIVAATRERSETVAVVNPDALPDRRERLALGSGT